MLPLQGRGTLMCYYHGPSDPSWVSPDELEEKEANRWLAVLKGLEAGKVPMEVAVEAFFLDTPPREVNLLA